ncbi:VacJ family lipoprotein [Planctomycetota bacterium]
MNTRQWLLLLVIVTSAGCASRTSRGRVLVVAEVPSSDTTVMDTNDVFTPDDPMADDLDDEDFGENEFDLFEDEFNETQSLAYDPIEGWNRGVFRFNDRLYVWILRPFVKAYNFVTPDPVRVGTRNFFHNLGMPARAINCLLQGKYKRAGHEVGRFAVNTTVGVFGCADPATDALGWPSADEDLGQTLAVWGVPNGPYLVWPILGPGTLRDSSARVGDYFLNPLSYADYWEVELVLKGVQYSNLAAASYSQYDLLKQEAIEPYTAMRDGYIQFRRKKILE